MVVLIVDMNEGSGGGDDHRRRASRRLRKGGRRRQARAIDLLLLLFKPKANRSMVHSGLLFPLFALLRF